MKILVCVALSALFVSVYSFGSSEDRFLKKYAMMKIYESCFGEDVVKEIRRQMKIACLKCADASTPPPPPPPPTTTPAQPEDKPPEDGTGTNSVYQNQPTFDVEKLHQAILAFRPSNAVPPPSFRPYPGAGPASFYNPQFANPGFPVASPMFYPAYQQAAFPPAPYGLPVIGQQYFGNRMSREMDVRDKLLLLGSIAARKQGRIRNVTCVMQELGYLDENLEPNYAKIIEKISNLPVSKELRRDMQDGVSFCQQFSQCVPEIKKHKTPLSREMVRPMFFFKCYKHKKLEACIMKDIREKYNGVPEDDDDEIEDDDDDLRRAGKAMKLPEHADEKEIDDMTDSMFEFLYASDSSLDMDGLL